MPVGPNTRLANEQAAYALLIEDIDRFEDQIERLLGNRELSPNEFDALVSLAFNIGMPNFSTSTLLKKVLAGGGDDVALSGLVACTSEHLALNGPQAHQPECDTPGLTESKR